MRVRGKAMERVRERERGREGVERCDFLVPLYNKSGTAQVIALAHFYVGS
jgi:hypothetical protein